MTGKNLRFFFFFFLVSFKLLAQQKQLTDSYPFNVFPSDSGFVLYGQVSVDGNNQGLIAKYNKDGEILWQNLFGGSAMDGIVDFEHDSIENLHVLSGNTRSVNAGVSDFFVVRTDPETGDTSSVWIYGTKHFDTHKGSAWSQNSLFLAGNLGAYGAGQDDVLLIKINNHSKVKKALLLGSAASENVNRIKYLENGKIAICGSSLPGVMGGKDGFLMVMDTAQLNVNLLRFFGGASDDNLIDAVYYNGFYYGVGLTESVGYGSADVFLVKLTETGSKEWSIVIGEWLYERPHDIFIKNGKIFVTGYMQSTLGSLDDGFISEVSLDGVEVKTKQFVLNSFQYNSNIFSSDSALNIVLLENNNGWKAKVLKSDNENELFCDSTISALQSEFANIPVIAQVFSGLDVTDSIIVKRGIYMESSDSLFVPFEYCIYEIDTTNQVFENVGNHIPNISVYPNPSSDYLNVKAKFEISEVQFFSSQGRLVAEQSYIDNEIIDVSNFPIGFYIIKLEDEKNNTYFVKFIKSETNVR